jgi:hypothetical protein
MATPLQPLQPDSARLRQQPGPFPERKVTQQSEEDFKRQSASERLPRSQPSTKGAIL